MIFGLCASLYHRIIISAKYKNGAGEIESRISQSSKTSSKLNPENSISTKNSKDEDNTLKKQIAVMNEYSLMY
jgi:hypothetical protein